MARPQAVPTAAPTDREQEIRTAEQEVAMHEGQLARDVAQLEAAAAEILGRLQHVKAAASQAQLSGVRDPAFAELHQRVHHASVQRLNVDAAREAALQARLQAVDARRRLAEQMRQTVHAYSAELSQLSTQLTADESALAQMQAQLRAHEQQRAQQQAAQTQQMAPPPVPLQARPAAGSNAAVTAVARAEPRRSLPRVRMQAAVDLHTESNFFTGFSTNISEGGLFIATVQSPPIGTEVDVAFTLPGTGKIEIKGVVRWAREVNDKTPDIFPGVGIQFVNLDPRTAQAVSQFVSGREPMFFPE